MTQKNNSNPWTMDLRVRDRNLKSGALTEKDLEKFLSTLPDLSDQVEAFAIAQPALDPPEEIFDEEDEEDDVEAESPSTVQA